RVVRDRDAQDPRRAPDDLRELTRLVVAEPERHPEPVAERRRQQARARGRPDEGERGQVEREGARRRPLADDDVEAEVLERGIEDLLDGRVQAVDLVDEEHVARLERGEDRRQVALALDGGARNRADADAELLADDVREARLAEPGRPDEEHVVERLAARACRRERDLELLLDPLLPHELREPPRAQGHVEGLLAGVLEHAGEQLASRHAAALNASRTRSSAGSSASISASARSASTRV